MKRYFAIRATAWAALFATILGGCTADSARQAASNAPASSPRFCGTGGAAARVGVGTGLGLGAGAAYGAVASIACGPFYPICLAAFAAGGAATGLLYGVGEAVTSTPSCATEVTAAAAAPPCAADDRDCQAALARQAGRRAEQQAADLEARASDQALLHDPRAAPEDRAAALAREQTRFDAWYAANRDAVARQVNRVVLQEGLAPSGCDLLRLNIYEARVSGIRSEGVVVDLRWYKPGAWASCEVHRHDSFLLLLEGDAPVGAEHLGRAGS